MTLSPSLRCDRAPAAPSGVVRRMRVDLATGLGRVRMLGDGSIAVPAKISRSGVLEYQDDKGLPVNEYRPPEEVFSQQSLDSFKGVTLTWDHPQDSVDPSAWQAIAIGHIGDDVRQEGEYVCATVYIKREDAIKAAQSGALSECSAGYYCDPVPQAGTAEDGVDYSLRQTNIRGNHVALGPLNWGRAGNNVKMYMDARLPRQTAAQQTPAPKVTPMDEAKKKLFTTAISQMMAALTAMSGALQSEGGDPPSDDPETDPAVEDPAVDAKPAPVAPASKPKPAPGEEPDPEDKPAQDAKTDAKADAARAAQAATTEQARIDAVIAARTSVVDRARAFGIVEITGKSNRQIMLDSIKSARPNVDTTADRFKPDAYVSAYFDALEAPEAQRVDSAQKGDELLDRIFGSIAGITPADSTPRKTGDSTSAADLDLNFDPRDDFKKRQDQKSRSLPGVKA